MGFAPTDQKVSIVTGASSAMGEAISRKSAKREWLNAMADVRRNDGVAKDTGKNADF